MDAPSPQPPVPGGRLLDFNISTAPYKTIREHAIPVHVLIPRNARPGKHPVLVRFHGGGLVLGSALYPDFFSPWIVQYALSQSAIIVMPDYRLLPEAKGVDILEDLADFWNWVRADLATFVSTNSTNIGSEADLSKILVLGDSAGGYLAIQSGITQPPQTFKAIIAIYPMLDLSCWFTPPPSTPLNLPPLPSSMVDEFLSTITPNTITTSIIPPARVDFLFATIQHGRFRELLGTEPPLFPLETIQHAKTFPPLFLFHGKDDTIVPVYGTEEFARRLDKVLPGTKTMVKILDGDHGFDMECDVGTEWLREGLDFITPEWVGS